MLKKIKNFFTSPKVIMGTCKAIAISFVYLLGLLLLDLTSGVLDKFSIFYILVLANLTGSTINEIIWANNK